TLRGHPQGTPLRGCPTRVSPTNATGTAGRRRRSTQQPATAVNRRMIEGAVRRRPKRQLLRKIRLVVLDVDGTMTDGRLYYGAEGEAMKAFDVRDGHGLRLLQMYASMKLAVLTGRRADLVMQRCRELSIEHVVGQSRAKGKAIEQISSDAGVPLNEMAFMGDDVNDLPAPRKVAFS